MSYYYQTNSILLRRGASACLPAPLSPSSIQDDHHIAAATCQQQTALIHTVCIRMQGHVEFIYIMCTFLIVTGAIFDADCLVICEQGNHNNGMAYMSAALPWKQSSCSKAVGKEAVMRHCTCRVKVARNLQTSPAAYLRVRMQLDLPLQGYTTAFL